MMAQRQWSVMLDTLAEVPSRAWIPGTGVLYRHVTLEVGSCDVSLLGPISKNISLVVLK